MAPRTELLQRPQPDTHFAAAWPEAGCELDCEWELVRTTNGGSGVRIGIVDASVPFTDTQSGPAYFLDVQSGDLVLARGRRLAVVFRAWVEASRRSTVL